MSLQRKTFSDDQLIHPTAVIHEGAQLGEGVTVGPHCVVGEHVKIGNGSILHSQVFLGGHTQLGSECEIYPFASVGSAPQDLKYKGEPTRLNIGDRTMIRECCTINLGTVTGGGVTEIGSDNLIMAYVHVAHDCRIGNHCVLSNNATLAGHVELDDWVVVSGGWIAIHQFVKLGAHSFIGGGTWLLKDVPPFVRVVGNTREAYLFGINSVGLERRGFSQERIATLKKAYRSAFRDGLGIREAAKTLQAESSGNQDVELLATFLENSERGIMLDSSVARRQKTVGKSDILESD